MQLYFAIALKINRSMLQYKLMNKWQITKTVWPDYSVSSSWVRNSTYVSSSSAFTCVCSLKACFFVVIVITHFNGWLDLSDFCKFNEMPDRESTWNSTVSTEELLLFPHLTGVGVERQREGRRCSWYCMLMLPNWAPKILYILDSTIFFVLSLPLDWRLCESLV